MQQAWEEAAQTGLLSVEHRLWNAEEEAYRAVHLRASPVRGDNGKPLEWFGTATDVYELLRLQEREQILLHALQHRVRNVLSIVRSVAKRTGRSSSDVKSYAQTLEGRINAMARTQNVLTSAPEAVLDLRSLIEEELGAQSGDTSPHVVLEGPQAVLSGKMAESMSLALHELATNAVKYGALSVADGQLKVRWHVENGDRLVLVWQERGVDVEPPTRRGFGSELIENVVHYDIGGTGRLEFSSDGVTCYLDLPPSEELRLWNSEVGVGASANG